MKAFVTYIGRCIDEFLQGAGYTTANLAERLLVFGGLSALALLFCSVVLDRIASARTDPYREVER